ncbi:T9SS type B sorting domain-containing protein [Flavobacterium jejuense]|uniref:T9SS type B sorting domain-containing protein n=1 Tax=Flavobacterium jejuense TaxID=1544455 RepID=A0ABX0IP10_9FLAO|nr:T9SS type B sorting domain-containing protein [Flavobacterium jejuense]NHN25559.1 T9SS type B sorting domain-containing protein [Flavobacterium jejuense]
MKQKITLLRKIVYLALIMTSSTIFAQNFVPFNPRAQGTFVGLKGNMLQIGNNILNRSSGPLGANNPYNGTDVNNSFNMQYIDIDGDASTFNSSTANLTVPVATAGCYRIVYAGLYWAGVYNPNNIGNQVDRTKLNQVKFKLPGGNYINITGTTIFDTFTVGQPVSSDNYGYAAYYDVTSLVQALPSANGTYGVGNIQSGLGGNTSGGWNLIMVYEDPLTTAKNITIFDGFSNIRSGDPALDIPISGFNSIPIGPVRAQLAFAALEGDYAYTNDRLRVNGTSMTIPTRAANNFFNSTINDINGAYTARNINSTNLLGFDAGIINVPNPGNGVIANNATNATIRLETSNDSYVYYMNAFAIEVIQPQINLVKVVRDLGGNDIGNSTVALGQEIYYDLDFQNIGNDDAIGFTIMDQLPINVTFLPADIVVPPGVTYVFDSVTNTLTFTIPDNLVTEFGANYQIRIRVRVAENCYDLRDACSNEITNTAYKTYSSSTSGNVVENQQPSASGIDACLFPTPGATNFIADIDDCTFEAEEVLCGSSVTLTAGSGYTSYQWHNGSPPNAGNAISGATNQSYTVSATGTYSVVNTAPAPCLSIVETFNVVDFNGVVPNPVIPYADQVDICPIDGSELPKIYLCGASDSQLIETGILNAQTIVWEVLSTTANCTTSPPPTCPNTTCPDSDWTQVGTGPNYNAVNAGEYRVTITFQNGCFRTYYFNVYKNLFTPTVVATDEICNTPGTITVNGVPPTGYEFSITSPTGPWQQNNNIFNNVSAGTYTVYTQQIGGGVGNCLFSIPNVVVNLRNFDVDVIVQDALCNGDKGEIRVQVNNVEPQYSYQLLLGGNPFASAGPIDANDYTFSNLNAGNYTLNVTTTDGCTYTQNITISNPPLLTVTGAVTIPLTCTDGEITLYPVGGTPPYIYTVSGDPDLYSVPNFVITTPGTYDFTVTDNNNCTATTSVTIDAIPPPVFTVTQTDILCYGESTGEIVFNVTNTNGYTILYSIDNGGNFSSNPVFSNLTAGTYETLIQYSLNGNDCFTVAQTITITQPAIALTASAGVSELAGCGPNGEGKVRITNPQGGTGTYEYSFDGGSTWIAANEAYLPPGTHVVCIRDSNLCSFCSSVTIDPPPQEPTITVNDPDFNCDGSATTTITVNNNGGNFSYTYLLDGNPNTPPDNNVFTNVPCGPHNVTVQYETLTFPTYSNLLFEDFGVGAPTTTPGINTAYCFENQSGVHPPGYTCNLDDFINDGEYGVTPRINPRFGSWNDPRDHTSNGTNPNGRFLCVNIGGTAGIGGILYSKPINNIIPNQDIQVSLWAMNLINSGSPGLGDPSLTIQLIYDLGLPSEVIVATTPTASPINVPKSNQWETYSLALNPGAYTSLSFVIRSYSNVINGNDVVIDDINVFQLPIACITEVDFPVSIDCNQAFSAQITSSSDVSCNGANDGQITIAAQNFDTQFYYTITDSSNNVTGPIASTTSPVTITGLGADSYTIDIQYDLSSTPCSFPFTQVIGQPNALVASAVLSSPATCLTGGTITASASGGTPNYQYELQDTLGNIIAPYSLSANNVFSNLPPGDYIVVVQDALLCTDPIDLAINIPVPTPPTAVIDVTSDLCYDGVNGATIVVTASGGVTPYTYSINGSTFGTSNTFAVTPGNYTIIVRDDYGCEVTLPAVNIAPQLTANAVLTSDLDCSTSPDAAIDVTINGGTPAYTYEVLFNTASLGTFPVTGSTFTYTTANPGNYQFVITDAIGCSVTTTTVTVIPLPVLNVPVLSQTAFNLCNGDSNGAFTVTASGGLSPYTYSIDGTNFQSGNNFTGLTAGNYTVTVMDANSCTETETITLTQPDPINFTIVKTDIQCGATGTEPGSIDVTNVTGGTAPFTYNIDNSTGTYTDTFIAASGQDHSFPILNFGIYTVEVVDANGCVLVQNNIRIASPPNSLNIVVLPTADCSSGSLNVCVNTSVAGGPYHFAIYQDLSPTNPPYPTYPSAVYQDADPSDPSGLCTTITNLIPGITYSIIVYDESTNCYYFQTAPGPIPTLSSITSTVTPHNVTCTGANDGSVSFTVSGYSGTSVSYQIYQALNNTPFGVIGTTTGLTGAPFTVNNFGVLPPGEYFVLLTENDGSNTGCTQTSVNFTISESPVLLSVTAAVTHNDNLCSEAGQITVTGSNGTPPYSYQIVAGTGNPAPLPSSWPGQSSNVFSNLAGGSYDIYIQDANGCIQPFTSVNIPTDTSPDITVVLDPATLCNPNDGSYSITVTTNAAVGVPPFTYSVNGSAFATYPTNPFTVSGLNSGTQTVIIKDTNGCTETETIIINPPLNVNITPSIAVTGNCGSSDGIITVNAAGGSGNYTYTITPNGAPITQSGNVFSNIPAGSYVVTVTDNTTGCFINTNVTLVQPTNPSFTNTVVDVTCNGGSNGLITINLTGSNPDVPYSYEITAGPVTFPSQPGNVFSGLPAGNYTVVVTSGRGCTTTQVITVNEPALIVVPTPTVTEFGCNAGTNTVNNASIVVTGVTGGSGTYINYVFIQGGTTLQSGTSNTYLEPNVAGGNYTIEVYDNNGCIGSTIATIAPFIQISNPTVTVTSPITCTTLEDITINVTTTGGVPTTLNYTVTGYPSNALPYNVTQVNNPNFTGLTIGSYDVFVENATTGCIVQTIHYVFNPNTFIVNATVDNNVTCFGGTDGSVSFTFVDQNLTPTNDAGPFTYDILNSSNVSVASGSSLSAGPFTVNNLPAGVYQLTTTLTGSPYCPAVTNFTITQPIAALTIATTNTPITCNPGNDGSISAVGSNGWGGPYEYQIQGPVNVAWSSTASFTGLSAGTYTVSVRDNVGCVVSTTVDLVDPTPISATISATPTALLCVGDNTATITVSGTTGGYGSGYLYSLNTISVTPNISSAPQTNNIFPNLGAGTYNVTITDSFNCTFTTVNVTITEPADQVVATLAQIYDPTCQTDAILELTATGGTAPYSYSLTSGGTYIPFGGSNSVQFTVPAGTYEYYVLDANNCIEVVSNTQVVEPVIPVSVSVDLSDTSISCNGFTTAITATATNGLGNYTYNLVPNNGAIQGNPGVFTNVSAGTYTVEVIDGDCSGVSQSFTITEPPAIDITTSTSTDVTCADNPTNGTITVVASGGTGTIQYSISSAPNETVNSGVFTDLAPGTYTVYVQDESGCSVGPFPFTINNAPEFNLVDVAPLAEICFGDGGSATFSVSGATPGTTGYTATETTDPTLTQNSPTGDFSFPNLPPRDYQFIVTDANGCAYSIEFTIDEGKDIQADYLIETICVNDVPQANVTILYNDTIDITELTFDLDNGAEILPLGENIFENVTSGPHVVTVTHTNTCQQQVNFTVVLPSTPNLTVLESGLNQFTMSTTDGVAPYEYTILNSNGTVLYVGSNNVYFINQTDTYTVIVTDANGCTDTKDIFIEFFDVEIPDYFTPGGDGNNDTWSPNYLDNYPKAVTYVFDRYSRKIITLHPGESWDGTYMGNDLPSGDYWYVLKLNGETDAREFIGNFTLYR